MKTKNIFQSEIKIPSNIRIKKKENILFFYGPLGYSQLNIQKLDQKGCIALFINDDVLKITSSTKSIFRSFISLLENKIYGVSQGYILYLRIVGIGYRCFLGEFEKDIITFKVGYSHEIKYKIPRSIRIFLVEPTLICLFSVDKNQVTQVAAQIRNLKPPSPYKGKGIRLLHEIVRIKQGKQK